MTNENWQHVESKQNPADLISCGINAEELAMAHLWWNSPRWISKNRKLWSVFQDSNNIINQVPEMKKSALSYLIEQEKNEQKSIQKFKIFFKLQEIN